MLTPPEMGAWLRERTEVPGVDYFRLEALATYRSAVEAAELAAYLAGEPMPDNPARTDWIAHIRHHTTPTHRGGLGQVWRKVHVVEHQPGAADVELSPYERFHLEFALPRNTDAGEQNRVLVVPDRAHLLANVGDFYAVDRREVLGLVYDDTGAILGAEEITGREAGALLAVADLAWDQAVPLGEWRAAHPQYRTAASAA